MNLAGLHAKLITYLKRASQGVLIHTCIRPAPALYNNCRHNFFVISALRQIRLAIQWLSWITGRFSTDYP